MFVEIDDTAQVFVAKIMAAHPKLVDTTKSRSGADPFVMAFAQSMSPQMMVVTEEYPRKQRIPDVCNAQNIEYCSVADLIETEGWIR
jgi:hypothetical protein